MTMMPQNVIMSGLASHLFAATMTLTVITFPTPEDLWNEVTKSDSSAYRVLAAGDPARKAVFEVPENASPAEVRTGLDACYTLLQQNQPVAVEECGEIVRAAARLSESAAIPEGSGFVERAEIVRALYCRSAWIAEGRGNSVTLDHRLCDDPQRRLAQLDV